MSAAFSLGPEATIPRAFMMMKAHQRSFLPVVCENRAIGLVTLKCIEGLMAKYQVRPESGLLSVQMSMLSPVISVSSDEPLSAVIDKALKDRAQAVIVTNGVTVEGAIIVNELFELVMGDLVRNGQTQMLSRPAIEFVANA